ncbi:FtsX-like permease family protein, partial [Catellatospora sp. NPDC049111]|uniref:FtsX-like permease family protein n=1 Tax=Catellatospora sp. NPDC049111 TaxID=3155271 RepID=UPI0033EAA203
MKGWISRARTTAGPTLLLCVLTMLAAALVIGAPRAANRLTDDALHHELSQLGYASRDLTFRGAEPTGAGGWTPQAQLADHQNKLAPVLRDRIEHSWWSMSTPLESSPVTGTGLPAKAFFSFRAGSGLADQADVVEGRLPETDRSASEPVEIVLTRWNATKLRQRVGQVFRWPGADGDPDIPVKVVGIVAPHDEDATFWEPMPLGLRADLPHDDGEVFRAVVFSDETGLDRLAKRTSLVYEWRYRIDINRLDMGVLPQAVEAAGVAHRQSPGFLLVTGLDTLLARFADQAASVTALLAVAQLGALVTLGGLALLAARVAVGRRRAEFALLRARGGALRTIGSYTLPQSLPVLLAAAAGALLGLAVPGRPAASWPILAAYTLLAALAVPVLAVVVARDPSFAAGRADLGRVSVRRRTAELSLLVLAGLGVWLLRRRGLDGSGGVDFYLAAVPSLLAAGAAVATLRLVPPIVTGLARLSVRGRGAIGFLGLARAGRTAGAVVGPVAVLVVAVSTAVFSVAVAGDIDTGRDRATDLRMGADVKVEGYAFDGATTEELAAVPGVVAVAPYAVDPAADLSADGRRLGVVYTVLVDGPAYARVANASGVESTAPGAITAAPAGGRLPAVVSAGLAERLGVDHGSVTVRGRRVDFAVAQTVDAVAPIAGATNFVVLPWQPAAADRQALDPTGFLIAGTPDPRRLREAGDAGQRRWIERGVRADAYDRPTTAVTTWEQARAELDRSSLNAVVTFAYAIGAGAGVALALLAIGFAVVSGARGRGTVLSRLRTMGLSRGQGRGLLLVELMPVVAVAVVTGAVVGTAVPHLIAPALGLSQFTDGVSVGVTFDPVIVGACLVLVVVGM